MTSVKPEIHYKRWYLVENQAIASSQIVKISLISNVLIMGGSAMLFSVKTKSIILILIALFFYSYSYAASVKLKTGQIIEGEIVEITGEYIKINSQDVVMSYLASEVESVDDLGDEISSLAKMDKDPTTFTIKVAAEYILQEKTNKAVDALKNGLMKDKNNFIFLRLLALIDNSAKGLVDKEYFLHFFKMIDYWRIQQYQDVTSEFQEALRIDSNEPFIYFVFANISFGMGDVEEATKNMQKAMELYQIKGDFKATEFIKKYL